MLELVYLPNNLPIGGYYCGEVDGLYYHFGNIIWVCEKGLNPTWVEYHEIGHYIWFKILSEHNKKVYEMVYERGDKKYSLIEDFANSYANYEYGYIPRIVGELKYKYFELANITSPVVTVNYSLTQKSK